MRLIRSIGVVLATLFVLVGSISTTAMAQPATPDPNNPLPMSEWPEPRETGPLPEIEQDGGIGARSVENCRVYNSGGTVSQPPRRYCFRVEGGGTYVEYFRVQIEKPVDYSHIGVQTYVQGPEGETEVKALNILQGNGDTWDINNFVKAGTYCLWIRFLNNQNVYEPWQTLCTNVA